MEICVEFECKEKCLEGGCGITGWIPCMREECGVSTCYVCRKFDYSEQRCYKERNK